MQAKSTLLNTYSINVNSSRMQTSDLLLWVISHVCKESGEDTTDNSIGEAYKNAVLICLYEAGGAEK